MRAHPALVVVLLAGCSEATPEARALREFAASYPESASPTGARREIDLVAAPTELSLVDGKSMKVWAYNGQVPGPTIRVRLGDTVRVRFENRLPQPTTVHWHGMRVPNAMDGVPHGTQGPVEPGGRFVYEFTPKDAGTFWYHPHLRSSEQIERGLYGVIIVEDREPPRFAADVVWILDDWLLDGDGQVNPEFNTLHDLMHDGRWGNRVTVNGRTDTTLAGRGGDHVRLRLLDSANGRVFLPDWTGLSAKVIAVDGLYVAEPFDAQGYEIAPGNRLDLDLTLPLSTGRFPIVDRFYPPRPNPLAELRVDDAAPASAPPVIPRAHVPEWREALSIPVEKEVRMDARRGGPLGIQWTLDGHAFPDHQPIALTRGRFHHLRFVNDSYRLHPIHLHGMFFRLLARNGRPVRERFFRDTVLIHGKESVDLGVVPLDEGHWMLHCHILEHAEAGMMTMIEVAEPHDRRR